MAKAGKMPKTMKDRKIGKKPKFKLAHGALHSLKKGAGAMKGGGDKSGMK